MTAATIFQGSVISPTATILSGAIVGKKFRPLLNDPVQEETLPTTIEDNVYIGYNSIIGTGSLIGSSSIVDDYCIIESRVQIGTKTLVIYKAQICNDVQIGAHCVIGGFIGERAQIGNRCRIFGKIIHSQVNPILGWDDDNAIEETPIIKDDVFIGFDAKVIGGITLETKSYICSNAIITRDVPAFHIAFGNNNIVHYTQWVGKLRNSPFFNKRT